MKPLETPSTDEQIATARAILDKHRRENPSTYDHELKFWDEHGLERMFG